MWHLFEEEFAFFFIAIPNACQREVLSDSAWMKAD